VGLEEREGHRQ